MTTAKGKRKINIWQTSVTNDNLTSTCLYFFGSQNAQSKKSLWSPLEVKHDTQYSDLTLFAPF